MVDTTMIFWIVLWTVAMLAFLSPLCWTRKRRQMWWKIATCHWNEVLGNGEEAPTGSGSSSYEEAFHYRLSRSQEDDIRESFLVEKMRPYTQDITGSDIMRREEREGSTEVASGNDVDVTSRDDGEVRVASMVSEDTMESPEGDQFIDLETASPAESRKRADSSGDLSTSDLGDTLVDEFGFDECDSQYVILPIPGQCRHDLIPGEESGRHLHRQVPNGCAICLSVFQPADAVTWSSNPGCNHVFHHKCILDWLHASGRKALRRQRRNDSRSSIVNYSCDPVARITKFPALCPCCRRQFIRQDSDGGFATDKDGDSASERSASQQGPSTGSELDSATVPPSDEELSTDQSHQSEDIQEIATLPSAGEDILAVAV